jgi:hypothetical protein
MPFTFKDGSLPGVCSVCGATSWSPRSNKCEQHKPIKVKAKNVKGPNVKGPNADGTRKPVVTQVVETAGAINARTFSGKPPTAGEWEDKLTSLVVLLTMTYVEYAVVKPWELPEPRATEAVAALGMTDDEARTIVEPVGYLLAKTEINKKHGREAIELLAFAPAILSVIAWAERVTTFRRQMALERGGDHVGIEGAEAASGAGGPRGGPPLANFRGATDPRQAPTARNNGDRPHVDSEDQLFTA